MPDSNSSKEAWEKLLWRTPRTLEWPDINGIASGERLLGFDFSSKAFSRREKHNISIVQRRFKILDAQDGIYFELDDEKIFCPAPFTVPLFKHLVLKMILNTHSTLIMGRLGRYEGNVMTFLKASNNKLIDRAIRYIDMILKSKSLVRSYDEICYVLFGLLETTPSDQSIVLATVAEIEKRSI
jgi:N-acetylmuramic acid 6-phosphate etherase